MPTRRCRGVHVDRHQRRGRMERQPGAGRQHHLRLGQRVDLPQQRIVEHARRHDQPAAQHRSQSRGKRRVVHPHLCLRMHRSQPLHSPGTTPHQPHRPATHPLLRFFRQNCAESRPLATLRCTHHPHAQHRALGRGLAPLGVRQEPVRATQRHERPAQRRRPRRDPAAIQVPHAVRRTGPPDRIVQQLVIANHRDAHLTRAGSGEDPRGHGTSQPAPRSS